MLIEIFAFLGGLLVGVSLGVLVSLLVGERDE